MRCTLSFDFVINCVHASNWYVKRKTLQTSVAVENLKREKFRRTLFYKNPTVWHRRTWTGLYSFQKAAVREMPCVKLWKDLRFFEWRVVLFRPDQNQSRQQTFKKVKCEDKKSNYSLLAVNSTLDHLMSLWQILCWWRKFTAFTRLSMGERG